MKIDLRMRKLVQRRRMVRKVREWTAMAFMALAAAGVGGATSDWAVRLFKQQTVVQSLELHGVAKMTGLKEVIRLDVLADGTVKVMRVEEVKAKADGHGPAGTGTRTMSGAERRKMMDSEM